MSACCDRSELDDNCVLEVKDLHALRMLTAALRLDDDVNDVRSIIQAIERYGAVELGVER